MSRFMFWQWVLTVLLFLASLGLGVVAAMVPMPLWGFIPTLASACISMSFTVHCVGMNLTDRRRGW